MNFFSANHLKRRSCLGRMSEKLLKNNKSFIRLLCETHSKEQRQALLDTATPGQIRAISELSLNLLHEHCGSIDKALRDKVTEHQEFFRKLATEERPFARKNNLLANTHQSEINQTGAGIFSFILPALGQLAKVLIGDHNE